MWLKARFPTPWHSWIGHTAVVVLASLVGLSGGRYGALAASVLATLYFVWREHMDKRFHVAHGSYDTPNQWGVSPRADRVGDMLGPIVYSVGLIVGVLIGEFL
jgi:hypothetical protein